MTTKGTTTRAAIYTRKSSLDERAGDNRSTTAQERESRALAERLGFEVVEVYAEAIGTSASHLTNDARPEFVRAMVDMGTRFDVLVAWALGRVTRKGIAEVGGILNTGEAIRGSRFLLSTAIAVSKKRWLFRSGQTTGRGTTVDFAQRIGGV